MGSPSLSGKVLRFGSFELDPETQQLRKAGALLRLQPQPFKVFAVLVSHAGQVVTREELRHELWGDDTFVDFEQGLNYCIRQIRTVLGDEAQTPRYIETIPRRGYRFIVPVEGLKQGLAIDSKSEAHPGRSTFWRRASWALAAAVVLLVVVAATRYIGSVRSSSHLSEKDSVVLADFANNTGDAVFDETLRQGLSVQLEQSPFLNLVSEQREREILKMMGQPGDTRITPAIARQICQRTASAAVVAGSIQTLGTQYVVGLNAMNCQSGNSLGQEQVQASRKEDVLKALGEATSRLRGKLGESLTSVQKFNTPIEQATTPSLEALHAYSLGRAYMKKADFPNAIPAFQRAIDLDPNFAMAYAFLGMSYSNSGESSEGGEKNLRKAYDLRERVSERERFYIESHYFHFVLGDLEAARRVYELWLQDYPRDYTPLVDMAIIYVDYGEYDKAVAATQEVFRLDPDSSESYANLASAYMVANRLDDAGATLAHAQAKKLDSVHVHMLLHHLAWLKNDRQGMAEQDAWCEGRPGWVHRVLGVRSAEASFYGHMKEARKLAHQAVDIAKKSNDREEAGDYEGDLALREALYGNTAEALKESHAALRSSSGLGAKIPSAFALSFTTDAARAQALSDELAKQFRDDSLMQSYYVPTIRARLALNRRDPSKVIEILQASAPYEMGYFSFSYYSILVKGEAYLAAHDGKAAAAEFGKIVNHPELTQTNPINTAARLGLARAYFLSDDKSKARATYEDFLTRWKDADTDIPILKQAKVEYAKLQ